MTEIDTTLIYRFAVALAIGILIGLERQWSARPRADVFAGVRTFALIALTGCTAALLADETNTPWPLVAVVLVIGGLLIMAYWAMTATNDIGVTTEISAILTLLLGAVCYWGYLTLAGSLAVVSTVLLSLKPQLQQLTARISDEDIYATLKFAVISLIVLPILPNRTYGPPPFDVLNPYNIWLMVVFISGISFLGYVLMKLVDAGRGIGLSGLLGGLVSSTAVTLTFAQRSRGQPALAGPFALAILVAWFVMFLRVLVEVFAVNRRLLQVLWLPVVGTAAVALIYAAYLYLGSNRQSIAGIKVANPFELGPAIQFGAIYAVILLVVRTAEVYLGNTGVYLSSVVSGLADVDAITLSMARFSGPTGSLDLETASRAVVLAMMSNTIAKAGIVMATGAATLRRTLLPVVPVIVLVALALTWLQ